MGNLYAESDMRTNNLQNCYEKTLGSDLAYTQRVNNGDITKEQFIRDKAGFGLAQWTFWSRKQLLYENTVEKGLSIDNLDGQLETLKQELKEYGLIEKLEKCDNLKEAVKLILVEYENPADKSDKVVEKRLSYAQKYFRMAMEGEIGFDEVGGNDVLLKALKEATNRLNEIVNKLC